jgi:hypothetical protein
MGNSPHSRCSLRSPQVRSPTGTPGGDYCLREAASEGELMRPLETLLEENAPSIVQPDRPPFPRQAKGAFVADRSPLRFIRIGISLCGACAAFA